MKKAISFSVLALVFINSITLAAGRVAVATKIMGKVEIRKAEDQERRLKAGEILEDGDFVTTGATGFAALVFIDDKSTLKIKENTELEITGKRETGSISKKINMDQGTLRAQVSKQAKGEFVVQTPTSVASVKGTDFWLKSNPLSGDEVIGIEGVVSLTNILSGLSSDITAGISGFSLPDGGLNTENTDPDDIPDDPEEDDQPDRKSELRIRFTDPDGTVKTLIIEYQ